MSKRFSDTEDTKWARQLAEKLGCTELVELNKKFEDIEPTNNIKAWLKWSVNYCDALIDLLPEDLRKQMKLQQAEMEKLLKDV